MSNIVEMSDSFLESREDTPPPSPPPRSRRPARPALPPPLREQQRELAPIAFSIDDEPAPVTESSLSSEEDLKKLLIDTIQKLKTVNIASLTSHVNTIGEILSKQPSLVNVNLPTLTLPTVEIDGYTLDNSGAPLLFAVFYIKIISRVDPQILTSVTSIITKFLAICKQAGANPLLKGNGVTAFEYASITSNEYILGDLSETFGFSNIITDEQQPKMLFIKLQNLADVTFRELKAAERIYNLLIRSVNDRARQMGLTNTDTIQLTEKEQKTLRDIKFKENKLANELNSKTNVLMEIFAGIFILVIRSQSPENYKLFPPINTRILDITNDGFFLQIACKGFVKSITKKPIVNNVEILKYIVKYDPTREAYLKKLPNINLTPLEVVLFNRLPDAPPSFEIVEFLLKNGASFSLKYIGLTSGGEYIFEIPEKIKTYLENPQYKQYEKELKKILDIVYKSLAIQLILATPVTSVYAIPSSVELKKSNPVKNSAVSKMLANLFKFHPEAFTVNEPETMLPPQKINPEDSVFDVIMQEDTKIKEFLEEDEEAKEFNVVFRNYDAKTQDAATSSTRFIDIRDIEKAVKVDYSKLEHGDVAEKDAMAQGIYDPQNSNHVPAPGEKGGRAVLYKCNNSLEGMVTLTSINNMEPYFDMKAVGIFGAGLVPLLELYSKIILPKASVRGQYFSYKVFDDKPIFPVSSISSVMYPGTRGNNRYDGLLNYVSATHCFGYPDCGPSPSEPGGWYDEEEWNECNEKKQEERRDAARLTMIVPAVKFGEETQSSTLSKPEAQAKPDELDPFSLNDTQLREAFTEKGIKIGPITDATRNVLIKKLISLSNDAGSKPARVGGTKKKRRVTFGTYRKKHNKTVKKKFRMVKRRPSLKRPKNKKN